MPKTRAARALGAAAPAVLVVLLTGCSGLVPGARATVQPVAAVRGGVEFVVGVHANGPAPDLRGRALDTVTAAIAAEQSIGVIAVDGRPRELQRPLPMSVTGLDDAARTSADRKNRKAVVDLVRRGRAVVPGADLFSALVRAASAAHDSATGSDHVVVLDSGLSDRGPLDLTEAGSTEATPKLVADRLLGSGALKKDAFTGLTVEFIGLGTAVAAPQKALPKPQVAGIRAIYSAVVEAGGGTVVLSDEAPPTGRSAAAAPVAVVPSAERSITLGGSAVLGDGSSIGFQPGTATFKDQAAATSLLHPLAAWLAPGSTHRATVVGRTSSEGASTKAQDLALSAARAKAVKDLLVRLGADSSRIVARGEGYVGAPPDRVGGVLDPAKAAQNRVVRITTTA